MLPSEKKQHGTFRPCRDGGRFELPEADTVPQKPDNLSAEAEAIWDEDLPRAIAAGTVTELDSTLFRNYCNLQAAIDKCHAAGSVPPGAHLAEARRLQELLGLSGKRSRMTRENRAIDPRNPFANNGRRLVGRRKKSAPAAGRGGEP
jgi:phage terminase small subunit